MSRGGVNDHLLCELQDHGNTHGGKESASDPMFDVVSPRSVERRQEDEDAPDNEIVLLIRKRLEQHPHFRGRASQFQIEMTGGAIVLSGRLPTYYLKQLLQEVVKKVPDVAQIENRVEVTFH